MLPLLELLLPDVSCHQGVTVLIHFMPEVLTCHANARTSADLQLSIVDITPLLHDPSLSVQLCYIGEVGLVNQR